MTKERPYNWLLATVLAGALLVGCGGGGSTAVTSGEMIPTIKSGAGASKSGWNWQHRQFG